MKKLTLTMLALVAGATLGHSQGTIILYNSSAIVTTNGLSIGEGQGGERSPANGAYYFDVLDMSQAAWTSLTGTQQQNATNLESSAILSLWTDTGFLGDSATLHQGGITGLTPQAGTTALNWSSPGSSSSYGGGGETPDYYLVVGWSANEGTTWGAVSNELATGTWNVLGAGGWFGTTTVAFNYAGGGSNASPPPAVSVWAPASTTGLAGSGGLTGLELDPTHVTPTPEPTTLAVAGLGGLSLLLFRRRKS